MSGSVAEMIDRAQGKTAVDYTAPRPKGDGPAWKPEWAVNTFLVCDPRDAYLPIYEIPEADFHGIQYAGHCAVQIWKSNHRDFPGHRFTFGAILPDGRFVPNISPRVEGQRQGTPSIDESIWDAQDALTRKARLWQQTDVAVQVDRYVDRSSHQRGNQNAATPRGIGKPGKTDRARAKGKARAKAA